MYNEDNYYDVFEEFGKSPATREEWKTCATTHDLAWIGMITSEFTRRVMDDYLHNHKDANLVSKYMDDLGEALSIQTGLSHDQITEAALISSYILEDREFRDNPEEARARKRESYLNSLKDDDDDDSSGVNEELQQMASEFAEMINNRKTKKIEEDIQLKRMEYSLASNEVEEALKALCDLMGFELKEIDDESKQIDNVINDFFGNNN